MIVSKLTITQLNNRLQYQIGENASIVEPVEYNKADEIIVRIPIKAFIEFVTDTTCGEIITVRSDGVVFEDLDKTEDLQLSCIEMAGNCILNDTATICNNCKCQSICPNPNKKIVM